MCNNFKNIHLVETGGILPRPYATHVRRSGCFAVGMILLAIVLVAVIVSAISVSVSGSSERLSSSESASSVASGILYHMESLRLRAEAAYLSSGKSHFDFYNYDVRTGGFFSLSDRRAPPGSYESPAQDPSYFNVVMTRTMGPHGLPEGFDFYFRLDYVPDKVCREYNAIGIGDDVIVDSLSYRTNGYNGIYPDVICIGYPGGNAIHYFFAYE